MEQDEITSLLQHANDCVKNGYLDEAFELYTNAAELGSAEAEYNLGKLWEEVECDFMEDYDDFDTYTRAEECYMNAAEKGHGKAALALANLYLSNYFYPNCFDESLHWFERAAELGELEAIDFMSHHQDAVRTVEAAEQGNLEAMLKAATLLFQGKYLKKEDWKATSYLRTASQMDYLPAIETLGERLYYRRNFKEAAKCFERALELGSDKWIIQLAGLYADDYGAGRNAKRAEELYFLALEKGDDEALSKLGYLYSRDPNLYDPEKALSYFEEYEKRTGFHSNGFDEIKHVASLVKFAEDGDKEAAFELGESYEYEGRGVPKDYYSKRKWYEYAAELGHEKAMEKVADAYYFGKEGNRNDEEVNLEKAAFWYERAAKVGRKFAIERMAFMYHNGEGVERNLEKAIFWMEKLLDDFYFASNAKRFVKKWKEELKG